MKLVFFGTGSFAVPTLRALAGSITLVVSQPDRPSGRGMKLRESPVKEAARHLGLPVESPVKSRAPEFVDRLKSEKADALVVASYGQILSQALLDTSIRGGINLHGSLLPKYRGAAPIQRAILNGESNTGVTLMQMDKGMDTGDIIAMKSIAIGPDETYGELQDRLAIVAADMAKHWMPTIVAGDYHRTPQNDAEATLAPKIEKSEGELRFDEPAEKEYARFRAFTPAPGAFLRTGSGLVKVSAARIVKSPICDHPSGAKDAGTILSVNPGFLVAFAEDAIELLEVQPEGKKKMTGRDLANGLRLKPGMNLKPSEQSSYV